MRAVGRGDDGIDLVRSCNRSLFLPSLSVATYLYESCALPLGDSEDRVFVDYRPAASNYSCFQLVDC